MTAWKGGKTCAAVFSFWGERWCEFYHVRKSSQRVRQFSSQIFLAKAPLKNCDKGNCYGKIRNNTVIWLWILYSLRASQMTETLAGVYLFTRLSSARRQLRCSEPIKFTEISWSTRARRKWNVTRPKWNVFEKLRFQNVSSVHAKTTSAFSNSFGLKSLRFRDRLVWTVVVFSNFSAVVDGAGPKLSFMKC